MEQFKDISRPASTRAELRRQVFTIPRESEYFAEDELIKQTGYSREDWWPGVVGKEAMDNGFDICEQIGVAPEIAVEFTGDTLTISDNGPGIPSDVVKRVLDYSTRTSDKAAYISPTRGAQGNALKTVLAIPYVLGGGKPSTVTIEAQGVKHSITVATDHIERRARILHQVADIVKNQGTTVRITLDSACSKLHAVKPEFLQKLLLDYSLFNPHARLVLKQSDDTQRFEPTNSEWRKWSSSDPTSAHWYNTERLEALISCYVAAERTGGRALTVREFVSEFRGLSATQKQKQVTAGARLDRAYLRDLVDGHGRLDSQAVARLLASMQQLSAAVRPEILGVLGEQHFRGRLTGAGESFRYKRVVGIETDGMPYIVECAFALTEDISLQGEHIGLNWAVPLSNPIGDNQFTAAKGGLVWGLSGLMEHNRISLSVDPVCIVLHLVCPRFDFLDRGKGSVKLPEKFAADVAKAFQETTKEWAAIKKAQDRDRNQADRRWERLFRGRQSRTSLKAAAAAAIPDAYREAAGRVGVATTRQVMYKARPLIQAATGESLRDNYFNSELLPEYVRDHPVETADWDVIYDARGHLWEPHTGVEIGIGTIGVREYLGDISAEPDGIEVPKIASAFPTHGHQNRYGAALYIEKEGFLPLLEQARFAERFDLSILSSKGMGSTAARTLIERLSGQVKILVLHDFDKSGFSIAGILRRDTRRFRYAGEPPQVIDIGLRLEDVAEWSLESEDVIYEKSDPTQSLILNGATPEEVEFLRGRPHGYKGYKGRRVELNAFTSDQFVKWLEGKLKKHGVKKVIPDDAMLQRAYRRAAAIQRCRAILEREFAEVETYAAAIRVPKNLRGQVRKKLVEDPSVAWDAVVTSLLPPPCRSSR